jgi:hypothetical protein
MSSKSSAMICKEKNKKERQRCETKGDMQAMQTHNKEGPQVCRLFEGLQKREVASRLKGVRRRAADHSLVHAYAHPAPDHLSAPDTPHCTPTLGTSFPSLLSLLSLSLSFSFLFLRLLSKIPSPVDPLSTRDLVLQSPLYTVTSAHTKPELSLASL